MKKLSVSFIIVFILLLNCNNAFSQVQYRSGGIGYFQPGALFGNYANLQGDLNDYGLINNGEDVPSFSAIIGGGGWGLMAERLIIGGSGFGSFTPSFGNDNTNIKIINGGGFFNVGAAAVNKNNMILYPMLGFGLMGTSMRIENTGNDPLIFGDNPIPIGTELQLATMNPMFEIALGFNKQLKTNGDGFGIGAQIGYVVNLTKSPWVNSQTDNDVQNVNETGFEGFFLTLTIGGGGFKPIATE